MNVGDFFLKLKILVEGAGQATDLDKGMTKLEHNVTKLLAGVVALNAAFYAMMYTAGQAALEFEKFNYTTGLSSEELQKWQFAASKAGVGGNEMARALIAVQDAQKKVQLGIGDFAPFQFLGVDVNQNPFDLLETLHQQFLKLDPAAGRVMAGRLGISENMFQWLRRSDLELGKLNQKLVLTNKEQEKLARMQGAWMQLSFTFLAVKNRIAEVFAEPMEKGLKLLERLLLKIADFAEWLKGGSIGAKLFTTAVLALIITLGVLAVALTLVAGAAALAFAPWLLTLGLIIFAVTFVTLLVNDLIDTIHGGKSAFGLDNFANNIDYISTKIADLIGYFEDLGYAIRNAFSPRGLGLFGELKDRIQRNTNLLGNPDYMPGPRMRAVAADGAGGSITQNNSIVVNGAGSPEATGAAVARAVKNQINNASGSIPAPAR